MTDAIMAMIQCGVAALAAVMVWRARRIDVLGTRTVLTVLAAGLSAGATVHIWLLSQRGLMTSPSAPLAFNVYWTSLSFFDPLGAILLAVWPRAGVALTLAIMVTDVAVNATAGRGVSFFSPDQWRLWCQITFGLFVLAVARRVGRAQPLWTPRTRR